MSPALLLHFVRQDLVDRHAASALGALWTLLIPLANILIFTLVFSRLMGARLEMLGMQSLGAYSYSVYLVTGLLAWTRSEEHTSELQSRENIVCRLLLEKKKEE